MNKDEKRELRRKRLMENKAYQTMNSLTRYMDRYYLDALIGIIPGWGDAIALLSVVPFVYFSSRVIKSIPLTLAVLNNALRDVLMGMIPFFVGDVIDFFHRANIQNMQMIQGFVDGDETIINHHQTSEPTGLAVSHRTYRPSAAHSPDDMGSRQLRQLPVFIGSIYLLNCQCLNEFNKLST